MKMYKCICIMQFVVITLIILFVKRNSIIFANAIYFTFLFYRKYMVDYNDLDLKQTEIKYYEWLSIFLSYLLIICKMTFKI